MKIISALLDIICPRTCVVCGERLTVDEVHICNVCNLRLPRTDYVENPYDNKMARFFWGRFKVEKAAALFTYESASDVSHIIYDIKYHRAPELAYCMGEMMAMEFEEYGFFDDIDAIVPVPLTAIRWLRRGYNQSYEIARGISRVTGLPIMNDVLKRTRFTSSQTQLSMTERRENVLGAFKLKNPHKVRGKHILIVDDVVTTGATIGACGEELSKAGDVRISIVSLGCAK